MKSPGRAHGWSRWAAGLLGAALLCGGLVACTAPAPAALSSTNVPPEAAAAPAAVPTRAVTIGYPAPSAAALPIYVALEAGIFARNGLDVTLRLIPNLAGMTALVAGELDVYDVASGSLVPAALSGADLVLIASHSNRTTFGLVTTPDIASPADLRGKVLGITARGASDDFTTQRYLRARGLDYSTDVILQPVGGIPEKLAAMEVGQIAGGLVSPPTLFVGVDKGYRLLDRPAELFEYQGNGLVLQRSRLQGPEGERLGYALTRSLLEGIRATHDDRALALRALERWAPSPTEAIAEQTLDWSLIGVPLDGRPTMDGLRAVIEDVVSLRAQPATLEARDLVELRFLDAANAAGR